MAQEIRCKRLRIPNRQSKSTEGYLKAESNSNTRTNVMIPSLNPNRQSVGLPEKKCLTFGINFRDRHLQPRKASPQQKKLITLSASPAITKWDTETGPHASLVQTQYGCSADQCCEQITRVSILHTQCTNIPMRQLILQKKGSARTTECGCRFNVSSRTPKAPRLCIRGSVQNPRLSLSLWRISGQNPWTESLDRIPGQNEFNRKPVSAHGNGSTRN